MVEILEAKMTGNTRTSLKIINERLGNGTGEKYYQTKDGRWWRPWDGIVRTGEQVKTKIGDCLK